MPFAFKASFQLLCVGQDTFLLNTCSILPDVNSGWWHGLLAMQMELPENPEFPGPGKSCREITAALVEPTPGRASVRVLITEKPNSKNLGGG